MVSKPFKNGFDPAFEGQLLPSRRSANLKRPLGKLKRQGWNVAAIFFDLLPEHRKSFVFAQAKRSKTEKAEVVEGPNQENLISSKVLG